ncbi:hypothetical protein [Undibacterium macrobrachii]|uniref:Uncharacterized protein n=1 Tax=Undibacterium macrobrachii TaxID=1119058 RepID=A0ABQ2XAM4_9BURK|nr:hypothetical protein [Undibacterium macrobrachii]GGX08144.1 hypothetical protein GCM10011282_12710 [Undibacterium macrobrachii]
MQELNMVEVDEVGAGVSAKALAVGFGCIVIGAFAVAAAPAICAGLIVAEVGITASGLTLMGTGGAIAFAS